MRGFNWLKRLLNRTLGDNSNLPGIIVDKAMIREGKIRKTLLGVIDSLDELTVKYDRLCIAYGLAVGRNQEADRRHGAALEGQILIATGRIAFKFTSPNDCAGIVEASEWIGKVIREELSKEGEGDHEFTS